MTTSTGATNAANATNATPNQVPALVSTEWLAQHLGDTTLRVADVRWYLPTTGKQGWAEYERGHIPGAVFADLDKDLARPAYQGPGRHPLPSADEFAATMSRLGIGDETHVVAYDDAGGAVAARLWWLLHHFGHDRVSVLDGGWPRWQAEGRLTESTAPRVAPATFTPRERQGDTVDKQGVRALAGTPGALLLDARAPERYEGRAEPVDPRPGHIPGARNAPVASNLNAGGGPGGAPAFKSPDELRAQYAARGVPQAEKVVAYCGSGVNACHTLLALHLAGYERGLLYPGSWSDWSSDPAMPAATGPADQR